MTGGGSAQSSEREAPLYAVSAEFGSPQEVVAAARVLRDADLGRLEIYSPVPLPEAVDLLGRGQRSIPTLMAIGGVVLGFCLMMGMCIYATAYDYVFDIGGRPLVSWPSFIVPSVSFAVLTAALVLFCNWAFLCRLPLLNHPSFNIPNFERASQDRYFLTVASEPDRQFDPGRIERSLARLATRPLQISRVRR